LSQSSIIVTRARKIDEILRLGGSIEYSNDEAGAVWMRRMLDTYSKAIRLNPEPEQLWRCRQSISVIREIMESRMYPDHQGGPGARHAVFEKVRSCYGRLLTRACRRSYRCFDSKRSLPRLPQPPPLAPVERRLVAWHPLVHILRQ